MHHPHPFPADTRQPDDPGCGPYDRLAEDFSAFAAAQNRRAKQMAILAFVAGLSAGLTIFFAAPLVTP